MIIAYLDFNLNLLFERPAKEMRVFDKKLALARFFP